MKTNKTIYIASFVLLGLGLIGLIVLNLKGTSVYFLTVTEVYSKGLDSESKIRIFGRAENIKRDFKTVTFKLIDMKKPDKWILVKYKGILPDTFQMGSEVIVEGYFKNHIFLAQKLMTKCPSKYKSK